MVEEDYVNEYADLVQKWSILMNHFELKGTAIAMTHAARILEYESEMEYDEGTNLDTALILLKPMMRSLQHLWYLSFESLPQEWELQKEQSVIAKKDYNNNVKRVLHRHTKRNITDLLGKEIAHYIMEARIRWSLFKDSGPENTVLYYDRGFSFDHTSKPQESLTIAKRVKIVANGAEKKIGCD